MVRLQSGKTNLQRDKTFATTILDMILSHQQLWGIWSTFLWQLLPGPFKHKVIVPFGFLTIGQIVLFKHLFGLESFIRVLDRNI